MVREQKSQIIALAAVLRLIAASKGKYVQSRVHVEAFA